MENERIIELLARQKAGEITDKERFELDQLMAEYPDSVYYEEFLNQLWNERAPKTNTDDVFDKHVNKYAGEFDLKHEEKISIYKEKIYNNLLLILSIICVIFIGIGGYLTSKSFFSNNESKSYVKVNAAKGIRKNIVLPDGTRVWLNAESSLSYNPEIANLDKRLITLSGEAFFQVSDSISKPFVIQCANTKIVMMHGEFNIKAYPGDKKHTISVLTGSAEVTVNNDLKQHLILQPTEKLVLTNDQISAGGISEDLLTMEIEHVQPVVISNQNFTRETLWKQDVFFFDNETFSDLKPALQRWFNISFDITDKKLEQSKFTGMFKSQNIDNALATLQLSHHFSYNIEGNVIHIY